MRFSGRTAAMAAAVVLCSIQISKATILGIPTPDHVVIVLMENHSFSQISGGGAPFIHDLVQNGASFSNAFGVTHPSEPNYFSLFSGSTQGVSDDGKHSFNAPTLAGALKAAAKSFIGYIETGSPRKHNPWESFANSQDVERNFSAFPRDFTALPTVSFVIPDLDDDMHDGSIGRGDRWLKQNLGAYVKWCKDHNSLLIVTFDEDDDGPDNRITTIFYGAHVKPGVYAQRIDHYNVLRTVLAMFNLAPFAHAAEAAPIGDIWAGTENAAAVTPAANKPKL
jgi:phosphatidylinositol-3-phosphatase